MGMQDERFARAVEEIPGDGPVPADPGLAVVAMLRQAATALDPTPQARSRMRAKLLVELGVEDTEPDPTPAVTPLAPQRVRRLGASGRLVVALAAALCLVLSLGAMSLLMSRDALPGDALYAVKRTAESASFGLTFGEGSKGRKHLEFASARLDELTALVDKYPTPAGPPSGPALTALTDLDTDAAAGSRLLTTEATNGDGSTLTVLRDWARTESARLTALRPRLPDPAGQRAASSTSVLTSIAERSEALSARLGCYAITSGTSDEIGPLPASGACAKPGTTAPPPVTPVPGSPAPTAPHDPVRSSAAKPVPGSTPGTVLPSLALPTPTSQGGPLTPPFPPVPGGGDTPSVLTVPLPLPLGSLPPLLPGLPGLVLGG
ncbi:hypothetical protein BC739_008930 [Kutzneria viridogrisea]|nr:hypothetical protein [Kutzneria viridogrisea]